MRILRRARERRDLDRIASHRSRDGGEIRSRRNDLELVRGGGGGRERASDERCRKKVSTIHGISSKL